MDIFDSLFGKNKSKKELESFSPQADDVKMWRSLNATNIPPRPRCDCLELSKGSDDLKKVRELKLHVEVQDTEGEAWKNLEALIQKAISDHSQEFSPGLVLPPEMWRQIITLPPSIANLKSVRRLYLYDSNLVQIPQEIGAMENLEELDIYTSYRLHWLPYEVTRCLKLKKSRASTRALYGNYKYRPPFPRLGGETSQKHFASGQCSVCNRSYALEEGQQVWISLRVAADVFPLLVNACSKTCIDNLPQPTDGYFDRPHTGGLKVEQPPRR